MRPSCARATPLQLAALQCDLHASTICAAQDINVDVGIQHGLIGHLQKLALLGV